MYVKEAVTATYTYIMIVPDTELALPAPKGLPEHSYVMSVSEEGEPRAIVCRILPDGSGKRLLAGGMKPDMVDSVHVAHLRVQHLQWLLRRISLARWGAGLGQASR